MTKLKFFPLKDEERKNLKDIVRTKKCKKCNNSNWKLVKNTIGADIVICRGCKEIFLAGHISTDWRYLA